MVQYKNKETGLVWEITGDLLKQVALDPLYELVVAEPKTPAKPVKAGKVAAEESILYTTVKEE